MSKYDRMIEENRKKSKEKIETARRTIYKLLEENERVSVPKLMKLTGLSRGFFYKNPTIRQVLEGALERQAGTIDPRREILNMAMEKQIALLQQQINKLKKENEELKKEKTKLQKALQKKDIGFIKKL